ncbi:MAG: Arylsulfatase, partial [Verrucomicrobiota bacterium]
MKSLITPSILALLAVATPARANATPVLQQLAAHHAAGDSPSQDTHAKPNVVIILADDLGYGDVKCYNPERGKIPTPNIDKLASQGMRFTDAHTSSGVCSPTRYTLLTGRYHWRSRLQSYVLNYLDAPLIAPGRLTLASLLKQHGYRTGAIGKWHLGWDFQLTADERKRLQ